MNCQALHDLPGLQFIPVDANKKPIPKGWQTSTEKHNLSNCVGVGLVCGKLSGGIEVIDVDEKYSLDGKLFESYKAQVHLADETLLRSLVVAKTKGGGYHLIYRCSKISGNTKLANRPTTEEERHATYSASYEAALSESKTEDEACKLAEKASKNDKVRVLIETRGEGGQIVCEPTPGYEFIFGDLLSISEITPDKRDLLHSIARQFNQVLEEQAPPKKERGEKIDGLSVFDDYNKRGDVIALLQEHGWKVVTQKGKKTIFLRPGQTTSHTSGNFDHERNWFSVFTTSSEFEPMRAYLPYAVYAVLECNKDFIEASRRLYDLGYGQRSESKAKAPSTREIPSRVDVAQNDKSWFANDEDYDSYLNQVREGTLQLGKTTGSPVLDEYFLFKEGNLVMTNGLDNSGKTEIIWYLALLSALYHGWKWIIFSSENTLGAFMRRMIQFYWGKSLRGDFAMTDREYDVAKAFIKKHFKLIKAQENLFNYKDIINLVKLAKREGDFNAGMIDPYNSLKIDLSGFSKLNTHEYHYEALSELKSFGQQNSFGWFVNHHAVTAAIRQRDAERKYPVAPRKEDTEGGGKVANKADEFITVHRITQHPTDWMITELHIRKVKDTETGGKPSPLDNPIKFERYKGGYAYVERLEGGGRGVDPIAEWHFIQAGGKHEQAKIVYPEPTASWLPYKENDKEYEDEIGF
jgi:hypothetical protein